MAIAISTTSERRRSISFRLTENPVSQTGFVRLNQSEHLNGGDLNTGVGASMTTWTPRRLSDITKVLASNAADLSWVSRMINNSNQQSASVGTGYSFTPPLDDSSAEAHPIARGTSLAPRAADRFLEETAGHCPSLADSARHGNGRHSRSAPAATSARRRGSLWTSTPP